jgi:hypothetical protein
LAVFDEDAERLRLRQFRKPNPDWAFRPNLKLRCAGVPRGCRMRDGRRGEVSASRSRIRDAGLRCDALAFDGAVDSKAADAE